MPTREAEATSGAREGETMKSANFWWLSFCNAQLPPGDQFLGACLVPASDIVQAIEEARRLGINPGGEVKGLAADPATTALIPARWKNRLLTRTQCAEMDKEVLAIQDRTGMAVPHDPEVQLVCAHHNKPGTVGKA